MRFASIAGLSMLLLSSVAHADFPAGEAAFQRQDYGSAFFFLKPDAEAGNPQAQYYLGVMLRKGQGIVKDPVAAAVWFQKAAMQGQREAINTLATLYRLGEGVAQDYQQARRWYQEAAKFGFENAQYRIALMYNDGLGVPKDPVEAYKWAYTSAAQGGQPEPARLRDKLAKQLSPSQIQQAQRDGDRFLGEVRSRSAEMQQASQSTLENNSVDSKQNPSQSSRTSSDPPPQSTLATSRQNIGKVVAITDGRPNPGGTACTVVKNSAGEMAIVEARHMIINDPRVVAPMYKITKIDSVSQNKSAVFTFYDLPVNWLAADQYAKYSGSAVAGYLEIKPTMFVFPATAKWFANCYIGDAPKDATGTPASTTPQASASSPLAITNDQTVNSVNRIYGRWAVGNTEKCLSEFDEYSPGQRRVFSVDAKSDSAFPVKIEQKGLNVVVRRNEGRYSEYEFVGDNQIRLVQMIVDGKEKFKPAGLDNPTLFRCDPAVVATGKLPDLSKDEKAASNATIANQSSAGPSETWMSSLTEMELNRECGSIVGVSTRFVNASSLFYEKFSQVAKANGVTFERSGIGRNGKCWVILSTDGIVDGTSTRLGYQAEVTSTINLNGRKLANGHGIGVKN